VATGADIVAEVRKFLGDPYVYGAAGPNAFDCSGLVEYVYGKTGVKVPRVSSEQWSALKARGSTTSDKSKLVATPGDLIFSQWPGDDATPGHVGIYIGNHQLIEAPKPGGSVQIADIDQNYFDHIYGVGHDPAITIPSGTVVDSLIPGDKTTFSLDAGNAANSGILGWLAKGPMEQALAGNPNPAGDPLGISGTISTLVDDFQSFGKVMYTLTLPSTWARVASGLLGTILLIFGLYRLGKETANA
jgi:hypothetical protein